MQYNIAKQVSERRKKMNNLGITLKKIRESKKLTIKELSEASGVGNGTIGDIEAGRNKSTIKTLEKLSKAMRLNKYERNLLFSSFVPKDIGQKILEDKVSNFSESEKIKYEEFVNGANFFFNDEKVGDEDKDKLMSVLTEIYFKSKEIKKKK
jgi:XRE family transcriptional regulator